MRCALTRTRFPRRGPRGAGGVPKSTSAMSSVFAQSKLPWSTRCPPYRMQLGRISGTRPAGRPQASSSSSCSCYRCLTTPPRGRWPGPISAPTRRRLRGASAARGRGLGQRSRRRGKAAGRRGAGVGEHFPRLERRPGALEQRWHVAGHVRWRQTRDRRRETK